jgi:polyisoprenoid-binding protein YceI
MSVVESTHPLIQSSGTWSVDAVHSTVEFRVRHMLVNTVRGWFRDFEGMIVTGENPSVVGTIEVESIETMNGDRDAHLRSRDFFDSSNYPEIAFVADELTVNGDDTRFSLGGALTIKGITRRIVLEGEHRGTVVDPDGRERIALALRGRIDRSDFGLRWSPMLEAGGLLVGEDVDLSLDVAAVRVV